MPFDPATPYGTNGQAASDQAEMSTANRAARKIEMATLIELQLISLLLNEGFNLGLDLTQQRQDLADEL